MCAPATCISPLTFCVWDLSMWVSEVLVHWLSQRHGIYGHSYIMVYLAVLWMDIWMVFSFLTRQCHIEHSGQCLLVRSISQTVELLDGRICVSLVDSTKLLSSMEDRFTLWPARVWIPIVLHYHKYLGLSDILISDVALVFLIIAMPASCKVISRCSFDLHFPGDEWCGASFHVPVGHLYVFFWKKCLFSSSVHFLIHLVLFVFVFVFCHWVVWVLCILWILTPYECVICKYLLTFSMFTSYNLYLIMYKYMYT